MYSNKKPGQALSSIYADSRAWEFARIAQRFGFEWAMRWAKLIRCASFEVLQFSLVNFGRRSNWWMTNKKMAGILNAKVYSSVWMAELVFFKSYGWVRNEKRAWMKRELACRSSSVSNLGSLITQGGPCTSFGVFDHFCAYGTSSKLVCCRTGNAVENDRNISQLNPKIL